MVPIVIICLLFSSAAVANEKPTVVLLHGLARTGVSMKPIESRLIDEGYRVVNITYPSRSHDIDSLTSIVITHIRDAVPDTTEPVDFVTHSMGGIVLRALALHRQAPRIRRAVMIAPPHHGSEIVDQTSDWWLFEALVGPAGSELGTDDESAPYRLPTPDFEFGVIAGSGEPSPVFSDILPGDDDGRVSVASTRIEGMADHIVLSRGHTSLLWSVRCHDQIVAFLKTGSFQRSGRTE